MFELLKKFVRDEEGQDFVEYALLLGGIALTLGAAVGGLGSAIDTLYGNLGTAVGGINSTL